MSYFKLDDLASWQEVTPGELLEFVAEDPRRVRFAVMTNAPAEVWATFDGREILVGYGEGNFDCEFTVPSTTVVRVLAAEDAAIFMRGTAADHRVPASETEVYTSIEPRSRRNTELDRMIMMMRLNQMQNEQKQAAELAAVRAELASKLALHEALAAAETTPPVVEDAQA